MTIKLDNMEWSEYGIARAISRQTLARKCVVLVENCRWTGYECDVLGVTTDLRIIDIEIKISVADLKRDAAKDKWWNRTFTGYADPKEVHNEAGKLIRVEQPALYDNEKRLHPVKVWKHYYAMPASIWRPELVECLPSTASGVLLLREQRNSTTPIAVYCERRAKPDKYASRLKPEQVMDIARLANLRMWEAYQKQEQAEKLAHDLYHGRQATRWLHQNGVAA